MVNGDRRGLNRRNVLKSSIQDRLFVSEDCPVWRERSQAGGVCAVEMALWDIAGKVYNIPVYQMPGGKWRDSIRIYADTGESMDPQEYGRRAKGRKEMGLT